MTDEIVEGESVVEAPEQAEEVKIPSAEETIRETIAQLKGDDETEVEESTQPDGSQSQEPTKEQKSEAARTLAKSRKGQKVQVQAQEAVAPVQTPETPEERRQELRIEPPARFPLDKKEWFNRQPREIQEEAVRGWQELESHTTKIWQDLNRRKQRYEKIDQIINHYTPKWNLNRMTDVDAIAELCATQDIFMRDKFEGADYVLKNSGVTPEELIQWRQQRGQGQIPTQSYGTSQPQNQQNILTADQVRSILQETLQTQQQQQAQQAALIEMQALQGEVKPDGTYVWPELHSDQSISRVQPLVANLRETQPTLSMVEATKRAINTLRILDGKIPGSPSPTDSRLSRAEQQATITNARQAGVSIRGRGSPIVPTVTQAKPGEKAEDTMRAVVAQYRNA
jgi:hypothetical protein